MPLIYLLVNFKHNFMLTVFSPAPTLLEMQQENLSLRLKNYKSLHHLTSQSSLTSSIGSSSICDENGNLIIALT